MLNLLCMLACLWDSMIMGSARGHKPAREARMALCCCALQTCFAPCKAVCLQYRSIRDRPVIVPFTPEATVMQKRIAANRLREIEERQQPAAEPRPRSPAKPRTRRKTTDAKQQAEASAHRFVRPPDKPVVVINRH